MLPLRLLGVVVKDASRDLMRHRGQHALAIMTLASGLVLAGGGLLGVTLLDRAVSRVEAMARVTVFAAEGADLGVAEQRLRQDPRFVEVHRVSREEATRRFLQMGREAGLMLEALGGEGIPEFLEVRLRQDLLVGRRALEAGDSLRGLPGVGDVVVDHERLHALQGTVRMIRSALGLVGLILLVAAGFSTGNVIRMSVIQREAEIGIMRLVGATEGFIRTPLVFQGALLGLAGSLLAVGVLFGLWLPVSRGAWSAPPLLVELARLGFFSAPSLLGLCGVGTLTGALGALWGFRATDRMLESVPREEGAEG